MRKRLKRDELSRLQEGAEEYAKKHFINPNIRYSRHIDKEKLKRAAQLDIYDADDVKRAIEGHSPEDASLLLENCLSLSFSEKMRLYIIRNGLRDSQVYKAARIDRRLFSKIVSDPQYHPSKDTCVAICLALKLTERETDRLLVKAGYALSGSIKRDLIISYFISEGIYDVDKVNEVLYSMGEKTLGS